METKAVRKTRRKNPRTATRADRVIGENLRLMRMVDGRSQGEVAMYLGVTYQQIQKYEDGRSRLCAAYIHRLAQLYHEPYESFFDGLPEIKSPKTKKITDLSHCDKTTIELCRRLCTLDDKKINRGLLKTLDLLEEWR